MWKFNKSTLTDTLFGVKLFLLQFTVPVRTFNLSHADAWRSLRDGPWLLCSSCTRCSLRGKTAEIIPKRFRTE
jgi:hypothetical protein